MNFVNDIISKIKYDSALREDVVKMAIVFAISRVYKDGNLKGLDNKSFLVGTALSLSGFVAYHLFVKDLAAKIQVGDKNLQKVVQIAAKVACVVATPLLIKGKDISIENTSYVVAGEVANFLIGDCLDMDQYISDPKHRKIARDAIRAIMITIVPRIVRGGRVTPKAIQEAGLKAVGFAAYNLLLA